MAKLKLAVLYRQDDHGLSGGYYNGGSYRFFIEGLGQTDLMDVTLCPHDGQPKAKHYRNYDVLLIYDLWKACYSKWAMQHTYYDDIATLGTPTIVRGCDAHSINEDFITKCYQHEAAFVFNMQSTAAYRRHLPHDLRYAQIMFGITKDIYYPSPWASRKTDKVLLTGATGRDDHYKLRGDCRWLPGVKYEDGKGGYTNDAFGDLLRQYCAGIAACTSHAVYKYVELPMCSCLTFMEVTDWNGCDELAFVDGESAIFINEDNYADKIHEYIIDPDNPKWQAIAEAGHHCAMEHYEQEKEIAQLAELIEGIL